VAPVVSKLLKQPVLTGTHRATKQRQFILGHHRISSGMNRISTVRPPGETAMSCFHGGDTVAPGEPA